jgi:hypothetical protein
MLRFILARFYYAARYYFEKACDSGLAERYKDSLAPKVGWGAAVYVHHGS